MKICYILNATTPYGGSTKAFLSLLNEEIRRGVTPFIVLPDKQGIYNELREAGIDVFSTIYRPGAYPNLGSLKDYFLFLPRLLARLSVNAKATYLLTKEIKKRHIDLIHTNVSVIDIGYRCSRILKLPHIYHIREYADLDFKIHYFPCKKTFHRHLDQEHSYSICITKGIQRHHEQHKSSRSKVIYDGIRPMVSSFPCTFDDSYLLYAGRIQYTKGLDMLLEAYALCVKRHETVPPLKIAGGQTSANYFRSIKEFIEKNKLSERISFLGERKDLDELMSKATALIVPSRHEGFGLCMPEAMFKGCLVVAHNTAGTKEQLDNGVQETGQEIALRFESIEQLASILHTVSIADANVYNDMKLRAFNVVNKLYTSERSAEQVFNFYNEIIQHEHH